MQVVVVTGDTGCGKSTQVPQYILEELVDLSGAGIICTQPRRVAARCLGQRVAEEQQSPLGKPVGYETRDDNEYSTAATKLVFATEGILLRLLFNPHAVISRFKYFVVDEVHERHVFTEIIIGMLRQILSTSPDTRLVLMSATMHSSSLLSYFSKFNPRLIHAGGRCFPVEISYQPPLNGESREVLVAIRAVEIASLANKSGHILVFASGEDECEFLAALIRERAKTSTVSLAVFTLYASHTPTEQDHAIRFSSCRKCIVATNVAETSLTIPNTRYVIDLGTAKVKTSSGGISDLSEWPIAKSSAEQRCGRAGRDAAGKCFRLYSEQEFMVFTCFNDTTITRLNNFVLQRGLFYRKKRIMKSRTFSGSNSPPTC